ncbi:lipocalin family protein [Flavobacterium ardleyense]|uniref:Lipocalin family protein n=1 Tax=Flavobacterium ardleyense TaxID=2038737 RepID=A0ABW5ZB88_9FLAO
MKKIAIFLIVLTSTLFSCSSSDDSVTINPQSLLGKWYIKGGTENGGPFVNYNNKCATQRDFQEFFNNGTITFNGYAIDCEPTNISSSIWSVSGNILTVSSTNFDPMIYEYVYTVESLTSEELIVVQTVNDPEGTFVNRNTYTRN